MLNFIIGLLLGGCIAASVLCCMQINRTGYYEREIRRLQAKLNNKEEGTRSFCVYEAIVHGKRSRFLFVPCIRTRRRLRKRR